ncbi:MAG: hypothetical protein ACRCUS_05900, partial [Anaerovoracaceae bacterium]
MKKKLVLLAIVFTIAIASQVQLAKAAVTNEKAGDNAVTATIRVEATDMTLVVRTLVTTTAKDYSEYGFKGIANPGYVTPMHIISRYFEQNERGLPSEHIDAPGGFLNKVSGSKGGDGDYIGWMFYVNNKEPLTASGKAATFNDYSVKTGDEIVIYGIDYMKSSSAYGFFSQKNFYGEVNSPINLKLSSLNVVEAMWGIKELTTSPVKEAEIFIGKKVEGKIVFEDKPAAKTSEEGEAHITIKEPGDYIIFSSKADCSKGFATITVTNPQWPTFRRDSKNSGACEAKTARVSNEIVKKWCKSFKASNSWGSIGTPILVGEKIYISSKDSLHELDKNGREIKKVPLIAPTGYTSNLAYGGGMIFVPIKGG